MHFRVSDDHFLNIIRIIGATRGTLSSEHSRQFLKLSSRHPLLPHKTTNPVTQEQRQLDMEHQQRLIAHQISTRPVRPLTKKPLTPQERPQVLPGGRKWRNPKDAYNEEFIAEVISSQAELIIGSTLG